jgi:hypothetical protein
MTASPLLPLACSLLAVAFAFPAKAHQVEPFQAHYEVWIDGKRRGESTMQVRALADGGWEHRVDAAGTSGLARLAGAGARQWSRFRIADGELRLQEAETDSEVAVRRRSVRTVFDWQAGQARWEGDVKPDQRGPLPLESGATNAPLLNLVLGLDITRVAAGTVLSYPLYERGRLTRQDYLIGPAETVQTPAGSFEARTAVTERPSRQRTTTMWFAPGLPPTPVRMLQTENGKAKYELRLVALEP